MKKILIISYTYPPSNAPAAQRPYALAKYLDKSKYRVTVITCSNADSSLGFDPSFNESLTNVELIKIKSKFGKNASSFRDSGMADNKPSIIGTVKRNILRAATFFIIPDKAMFWYPNVISFLKKDKTILNDADVVFTTSPLFSNHLVGNFVKKIKPVVTWIADFRDFHYVENWEHETGPKSIYHRRLEQKVMKRADAVTFISSAMQKVYENFYPEYLNKMKYVYNGFDTDDFKFLSINVLNNKKLTIFYAGSFYKGVRSPIPLLSLLDESIKRNYLSVNDVVINIAGNFEQELLDEAKAYSSFSCVKFLGRIPRTEVLERLTKSDLLWLIVGDKITHYTGVPIKFYEYLAARRPIINFAPDDSEPTKIINELELGFNFNSINFDLNEEMDKIEEIINMFRDGRLKQPLSTTSVKKFTREKQALIFQEIM